MKKLVLILSGLVILLTLSNLSSGFFNIFQTYHYQTENAEFEFTTMPSKGRDIAMMERQFADFKETKPEYGNLKLHRTFKRNPLQFWNWYSYLTDRMYQYEYQNEVESKSGKGRFGI
jgi:hypothetical protein